MATSEARIQANRQNALRSTGPRTPAGKAISRRNSLKHGMTGAGIVLPNEDQVEVDRRFGALERDFDPSNEMGAILVMRIATLSVRMERCVKEEAARLGEKVRHASDDFDDVRLAEVEKLIDWIAAEPATNARRLRRTPEGVDRMIKAWLNLADDLDCLDPRRWGYSQWQLIENLRGRRPEDFPISRDGALCKTIWNDSTYLGATEIDGLDELGRRQWARTQLQERIAAEVAALRALRASFDPETLAQDRAGAAARAMFDASKEAILARKYEAAAERGFYRAVKELRQVEAEAQAKLEAEGETESEDDSTPLDEPLASIVAEVIEDDTDEPDPDELTPGARLREARKRRLGLS